MGPSAIMRHEVSVAITVWRPSVVVTTSWARSRGSPKPRMPGLRMAMKRPLPSTTPMALAPRLTSRVTSKVLYITSRS